MDGGLPQAGRTRPILCFLMDATCGRHLTLTAESHLLEQIILLLNRCSSRAPPGGLSIRRIKVSNHPDLTRRSFFRGLGRISAAACTLTEVKMAFAQSVQKLGGESHDRGGWESDRGYWEKIRKQFLLEEGFAYLNT